VLNRPLTLVLHNDEESDWRPDAVLRQWDPEHQLIGALMHLPAARLAPILQLVPGNAIRRPEHRWAIEIIRSFERTMP
jgi:hypothetical protein